MNEYQSRKIRFKELLKVEDWHIKVYTVSIDGSFNHSLFYENVKNSLTDWLQSKNSFNSVNNKVGFLILHPATEGIFSIISWWVGGNMLNSNVYLSAYGDHNRFNKISGDGLGPCVWELEVINHERLSWIKHFLKAESKPDLDAYLKDVINTEI
ncbi:MAG: hypothetical protein AB8B73_13365 [Ekhidna sp.]